MSFQHEDNWLIDLAAEVRDLNKVLRGLEPLLRYVAGKAYEDLGDQGSRDLEMNGGLSADERHFPCINAIDQIAMLRSGVALNPDFGANLDSLIMKLDGDLKMVEAHFAQLEASFAEVEPRLRDELRRDFRDLECALNVVSANWS